jgi:hypothetical protein
LRIMNVALLSQPQRELRAYLQRVAGDGGIVETPGEASTFIRRLRSAGVLGSTVIAGVAGGYKAGKLYSIIGPDLDVTRGTVANRINRAGSFASVASGVPATTYADGVLKGTYVRSSLQNLFRDSEPATDPGQGTRDDVTFAINDWGIGLDGKVVFGDNSVDRFYYNTGISTEGTYSAAFIIKPDNGIQPTFGVGGGDIADFRVGSSSSVLPYEVTPLGGGLFFVTVARSITTNFDRIGLRKQAAANNSIGFEASAIMVVAGSVNLTLEDYIKTTNSAQTRNADVITKTGLGSVLPQTEGWVYAEVDVRLLSIARRGLSFTNDLTATILNGFIYSVASTNLHQVILRANNAEVFRIETAASAGIAKVLFRFASGNSKLFINAVESGVRTQSFSFTGLVDVMALGSTQNGTNQLIDPIHSYAIGSGPITDAQAIQLTTL